MKNHMKTKALLLAMMLVAVPFASSAQSVSSAQALIKEGKYLEAAKQLRPLADGGNAEAQAMAAELFFEGKGVNKSEVQGIKYATMSADQGNAHGVSALFDHYRNLKNPQKAFSILKKYTDRFPELQTTERSGWRLLECYLSGYGTTVNEDLGWTLFEKQDDFDWNMKYMAGFQERYWLYKAKKVGKSSLEAYTDYLWTKGEYQTAFKVSDFIYEEYFGNDLDKLKAKAETSDVWAMTRLAHEYNKKDMTYLAKNWASKAAPLSSYAKTILQITEEKIKKKEGKAQPSSAMTSSTSRSNTSQPMTVEVTRMGLIKASCNGAYYRNGTVQIGIDVTTPMVRRQFRITGYSAKDASGSNVRVSRVTTTGIQQEPGRDYYIITDKDVAHLNVVIPRMPSSGRISELRIDMSLSGAKNYAIVRNVSW